MSDFLHNLRSGKFKRNDRNNRSYNDAQYRGSQRRSDNDKRKHSKYSPAATEQITDSVKAAFTEIKGVLEDIAANQKMLVQVYELTVKANERGADALESIAEMLKQQITNGFEPVAKRQSSLEFEPVVAAGTKHAFDTENLDREQLHERIISLREEGVSYDKIAQYLESERVPTLSGKGKWRGQAVSKLCKQMENIY